MHRIVATGRGDLALAHLLGDDDVHPAIGRAFAEEITGAQHDCLQPPGLGAFAVHGLDGDANTALDRCRGKACLGRQFRRHAGAEIIDAARIDLPGVQRLGDIGGGRIGRQGLGRPHRIGHVQAVDHHIDRARGAHHGRRVEKVGGDRFHAVRQSRPPRPHQAQDTPAMLDKGLGRRLADAAQGAQNQYRFHDHLSVSMI